MKQNMYTGILLIIAVCFTGCEQEPITQETVFIIDLTENYFQAVDSADFSKMSAIAKSPYNGEHMRIVPITESGFNTIYEFSIDPVENKLLGNDHTRKTEVEKYRADICHAIYEIDTQKTEREGSIIFKVLAEQANRLSKSDANKKIMVVFSDGMEYSSLANFYLPSTFNELQTEPEGLYARYLDKYPLEDLSGISIYFIYKPRDAEDSERFEIVSNFYKGLFDSCGAEVIISGSL